MNGTFGNDDTRQFKSSCDAMHAIRLAGFTCSTTEEPVE